MERPSWQAQLSGRKTWHLRPPPECEAVCQPLDVTVEKGEIGKVALHTVLDLLPQHCIYSACCILSSHLDLKSD